MRHLWAIEFKLPLKQLALKSELSGWRHYPIRIEGKLQNGKFDLRVAVRVTVLKYMPMFGVLVAIVAGWEV